MLDEEIGDLMIEELIAQFDEARRRIKGYQNLYFAQQERIEELEGISKYKTLEHQATCDKLHEAEDRIDELEQLLKERTEEREQLLYDNRPTDPHHGGKMSVEQMAKRIEELEQQLEETRR